MKMPKITKKHFQLISTFCKQLTYMTLICNHKVAISACHRNCEIKYPICLLNLVVLSKQKRHFLQISVINKGPPFHYQRLPDRNILRHRRNLVEVKKVKKRS